MAKPKENKQETEQDKAQQQAMQKKYIELQMLDSKMKQVQQQMQLLASQAEELEGVMVNIDEFGRLEISSETLVPLANGIFAKAELKDNKELLVNVGGNTIVAKPAAEAKELIANQQAEIRKVHEEMVGQLRKLASKSEGIAIELQKFMGE